MFEIGSTLREARERQAFELADVERATKIRLRYLAALEEERFERLPGGAYAKGFLRSYAEFLGLEGQLFVDEYAARFAPVEVQAVAPKPVEVTRRLPPRPLLGGGALGLVLVAAALAWVLARPDGQRSSAPARSASNPVQGTVHQPAASEASRLARLVLVAARGDCWLLVREGSEAGTILYEATLRQGASLRFARRRLWIRLGAPSNIDARLNGRPIESLPSTPANLLLTPARARTLSS